MLKYQFYPERKYFITYSLTDQIIVKFDDPLKEIILNQFNKAAKNNNVNIEYFAILNNHLHLIIDCEEQKQRKKFLKDLAGASARLINIQTNREGQLWKKYYAWAIFDELAYANISAYILGNPLRHGIIHSFNELKKYKYCNFQELCKEFDQEELELRIMSILKIKKHEDENMFLETLCKGGTLNEFRDNN
ncbi:hypothetical protein HN858_03705 [Candidatus Falkowbacteria bacterium]|jgi:REP element-mobilizing transposase RayT|nr:hypothetical protein [Candidatus Falkowbacteria bacterium]MBT5503704.1 hypothetical protein [Candidatus Falkowbacteria bacterium]MBT6573816.1 hypothetical protein [Candidatus Falkowbacteria bacterium]MBT7348756.1 hypothetical protein [Candidatus Falkowbacteria bacterium]MBT7500546.1 hypothetical protein [Candidatus Falkowbacteria bacterium]